VWVVWLFAYAACYRGPSGLAPCSVRCTDGCPSGTSCVGGFCSSDGQSCPLDAPACGEIGGACCDTDPACGPNAYCMAGTCQAGCITSVGLGRRHTCVAEHDGSVACSGNNDNGELGTGSAGGANTAAFAPALDAAGPIKDATAVCAGYAHSCAVRTNGTVWCWGYGGNGQLGDNMYADSPLAVQVVKQSTEPLTGMVAVTCSLYHSCARGGDGTVWCWGDNALGELGDNTGLSVPAAVQVANLTNIVAIDAGHTHTCAIDGAGIASCWGQNNHGQIGDGTQNNALAPLQVSLSPVRRIATGSSHTCAILNDTTLQCWGSNIRRWIGTGAGKGADTLTPTAVLQPDGTTPYTGVTAIALGAVSCAIRNSRVECWGDDIHGQAGNGGSLYPRSVNLGAVDQIVASFAHVCAHVTANGELMCWGRNSEGQLGDDSFRNRGTPTPLGATCATN